MCLLWVCPTNGIGQCVVFVFGLSHTARVIRASPRLSAVRDAIQNSAVWLGHVLCAPLPVDGHLDRFQPGGHCGHCCCGRLSTSVCADMRFRPPGSEPTLGNDGSWVRFCLTC